MIRALVAIWLSSLCLGHLAWMVHDLTPGPGPKGNPTLDPSEAWQMEVYLHPRCGCSTATVGAVAEVVRSAQVPLRVRFAFLQPLEGADGWERTDLWRDAEAIPGAEIETDLDGTAARRAGAITSGSVLLYAPNGELAFRGGVTAARGSSASCEGRRMVQEILSGRSCESSEAPVFGCRLFSPLSPNGIR